MTTVSVCVATFGTDEWREMAQTAIASAHVAGADEVIYVHGDTLSSARNFAASQANGEWLCFLDADDELAPHFIDAIKRRIRYFPHIDVVQPAAARYGPALPAPEPAINLPRRPLQELNWLIIGCPVRKTLFDAVGGFDEYPHYEDWAFWLKLEKHLGRELLVEPEPFAVYRVQVRHDSRNFPARDVQERMYAQIRSTYA